MSQLTDTVVMISPDQFGFNPETAGTNVFQHKVNIEQGEIQKKAMDEFFEMITLIQTGKAQRIPVICVGKDFWDPLFVWVRKYMLETYKTIASKDLELYSVVDTAEETFSLLKNSKERTFF